MYSRFPIRSHDYILLPRNPNDNVDTHQRACLHVEVALPQRSVHVFLTHLSLSEPARDRSVVALHQYMARFPEPQLLLGDLNAEPDTPAMRLVHGEEALFERGELVPSSQQFNTQLLNGPQPGF